MKINKANQFFGNTFLAIGAAQILLIILVLTRIMSNLSNIQTGGSVVGFDSYSNFSTAIGVAQFILSIASIIMIILNIKAQPQVIIAYFYVLGAVAVELLLPSFFSVVTVFISASMYIKAGSKIKDKNVFQIQNEREHKKLVKQTNWFYSEENDKNEEIESKNDKIAEKFKKELDEWKQLLELGEIDEETYKEETNKLIEKEKKRINRMKK